MILNKIELNNFKKHKSLVVNLLSGLNTIAGPNYSGKSTIQQAILYALFGTATVPGKGDDILTKGTKGKPSVELNFSIGSDVYTVTRSGSNATLLKGTEVISRSASAVGKEIEKLMGLTKDQFLKTRVSKQGDAHALLSTGTQELKKLVEVLSGCAVVDRLYRKASNELKTSTDKIEALSSTVDMSVDISKLAEEVDVLSKEEAKYQESKIKYEANKHAAQTDLRTADDDVTKVRAEHKEYTKIASDKVNAVVNLKAARTELLELLRGDAVLSDEDHKKMVATVTEVEHELKRREKELLEFESSNRAIAKLEKDLKSERTKLSNTDVGKDYTPEIEGAKEKLEIARSEETATRARVRSLQKLIEGGMCDSCKRPLGDLLEEELSAHISELDTEKDFLALRSKVVRDLSGNLREFEGLQKKRTKDFRQANDINITISFLEVKMAEALKYAHTFDTSITVDDSELQPCLDKLAAHRLAERLISKANSRVVDMTDIFESIIVPVEPDLQQAEEVSRLANQLHREAMDSLFKLMDYSSGVVADLVAARLKLENYSEVFKQVSELSKNSNGYKSILKVIKDNRSKMMEGIWAGLLEEASQFVSSCTNNDISAIQTDEKFNLTYKEGDYEHPIDAASGAQKSLIGLGIRLAISNMLPSNVDFLLLDEISADLEDSISVTAMAAVRMMSSQTVCISHRAGDATASDNIINLGS